MTNNHISFPSIEQFRSVIKHVKDNANYHHEPVPTLMFTGTVKLHGTNHGVCMAPDGTIYTQSRERITTFESDNAGSHAWTMQNRHLFEELFARIKEDVHVGTNCTIQVFGEWCGGNIQKGVGLNYVPKMFVVFGIRISENSDSQEFLHMHTVQRLCGGLLLTTYDFPIFTTYIDFSYPEQSQATLVKLTEEVERDCPVARQLLGSECDKELIGEGLVWETQYKGRTLRFKTKGEKHSISKVKILVPVDIEKLDSIKEFVACVVTEARLTQGLEHVESREPKNTGVFLKWVMSDIFKEESDTMIENGFTSKEVSPHLSTAIRNWFLGV